MSRNLAPYCKSILGADVSDKSIDIYNSLAESQSDKLKAVAPSDIPAGAKFDVIVVRSKMERHGLS